MSELLKREFLIGYPLETAITATREEYALRKALQLYHSARASARRRDMWAKLTGKPKRLVAMPEVYEVKNSYSLGIRSVEIDKIKGSEGRSSDYNDAFQPLKNNAKDRWVRMAMLVWLGAALPPVELIQVDDVYFVRDGHNRISTMRALGCKYVDACVTRLETSFSLKKQSRSARTPAAEFISINL